MKLSVNEVLRVTDARLPMGSPSTEFEGGCTDSRRPVPGSLFVGLRGEFADGGLYAWDAMRDGAAAALVGETAFRWTEGELMTTGKPVIVAKDPLAILQAAGRLALERSGAKVVGVTGATGKTTTKDILLAMLRAAGVRAHGTPGNFNTEVGVPLALLDLPEDTDVAVVEMGMRGPGQIAELARLAPPDVSCITAIGPVHLELLGSVEAVAAAKAEIIQALRPGGTAIVPAHEPLLDGYIRDLDPGVRVVRFGARPEIDLDLNISKAWQLENAAAAYACLTALGYSLDPGAKVEVELSKLRGQERDLAIGGRLIEDCYNANPLAMRAALADLAARPGRRVAVLGDMMELGPDEARYHREVGVEAARLGIDLIITVGSRAAGYAIGAQGVECIRFATLEEALEGAAAHVRPGDTVLVKGSRSMALERLGDVLAAG